jgi:NAD-dependent deacetylase
MNTKYKELKKIINESKKILAFSGAGISAESGISTFRGVGGLWSKYDPNIYANVNVFMQDSTYYWNFFKDERYPVVNKAKPNEAHLRLVKLEKQGKLKAIITQNIDGLHQLAGSNDVIELHGNTRIITCLDCKKQYNWEEIYKKLSSELPPLCNCGGKLKPNTVLFGEQLPKKAIEKASILSKNCDLFIVLGSSLVVYPAASFPELAKSHGAKLVIINIDPTPLDTIADLVINKSTSKVLSEVIK